jgi:hypothetical protein
MSFKFVMGTGFGFENSSQKTHFFSSHVRYACCKQKVSVPDVTIAYAMTLTLGT